ncbi:MAG: hypothetical protein U0074_08605 [Kouleothrix sp.]
MAEFQHRPRRAATGVTILEYIPDFAYLVQGTAAQLGATVALPQRVVRHTPFTLADKLAPALLDALEQGMRLPADSLRVVAQPGRKPHSPISNCALPRYTDCRPIRLRSPPPALPAVRWVEPLGKPQLLNDVAHELMHVNAAWQARNLFGAGRA